MQRAAHHNETWTAGGEEDVRNDGASSRSCSPRQKVEGFNVVAVWKHEEAMEEPREYAECGMAGTELAGQNGGRYK